MWAASNSYDSAPLARGASFVQLLRCDTLFKPPTSLAGHVLLQRRKHSAHVIRCKSIALHTGDKQV